MEAKKLTVTIPINDWGNEYAEVEPKLLDQEDLVELLKQPHFSASKIGRLAIVARERGDAPQDIIPGNKLLLNAGAAVEISSIAARRKTTVELADGREIEVREFVAPYRDDEVDRLANDNQDMGVNPSPDDYDGFVPVHSTVANTRATNYLLKKVPGYIYGRLAIIAANGGEVQEAAELLKDKIDEMVKRLG